MMFMKEKEKIIAFQPDDAMSEKQRISYIKMDLEGTEYKE